MSSSEDIPGPAYRIVVRDGEEKAEILNWSDGIRWLERDIMRRRRQVEADTQHYGSIGWAISHMRHGWKLRRRGWNGKDMWVSYVPPGSVSVPQKFGEGLAVKAFLVMKTADGEMVPWLASQTDLLATDWELVNAPAPGHTTL